jgi:hypothetical protein
MTMAGTHHFPRSPGIWVRVVRPPPPFGVSELVEGRPVPDVKVRLVAESQGQGGHSESVA